LKSACYEKLAIATGRAEFCAMVVPQTNFLRDGSGFSKEYCENELAEHMSNPPFPGQVTQVGGDELRIFQEAGYLYADLRRFASEAYSTVYERLMKVHQVPEQVFESEVYSRFYEYIVTRASECEREECKRRLLNLNQ
jgi:hypothetical protein